MARWLFVVACLLVTVSVEAFQTPGSSTTKRPSATPEPKLPGAVTRVPDGIGPGAPFDLAAYFAAPRPELNAALLYLDALFRIRSWHGDLLSRGCRDNAAETNRRTENEVLAGSATGCH